MIDIVSEETIKQTILDKISKSNLSDDILNCLRQFHWKALIYKQDDWTPFQYTYREEKLTIYFDYNIVDSPFLNYYEFILNYKTRRIKVGNTTVELTIPEFNSYIDDWIKFEADYRITQNHYQRRFFFDFVCSKQYVPARLFCLTLNTSCTEQPEELNFTLESVISKFPNYFEHDKNKYWMFYWRDTLYVLEYSNKFKLYISNRVYGSWRNNLDTRTNITSMYKILNLKFQ